MKRFIDQVIISIKVKRVIICSGREIGADPIELIFDDFYGPSVNLII